MNINLMQLMQMMKNPQHFAQQMINNSQVMQNPMAKNAIELLQKGDMHEIETMARNLCKEKGIDPEQAINQLKMQFNQK